jgi:hypothetical protein
VDFTFSPRGICVPGNSPNHCKWWQNFTLSMFEIQLQDGMIDGPSFATLKAVIIQHQSQSFVIATSHTCVSSTADSKVDCCNHMHLAKNTHYSRGQLPQNWWEWRTSGEPSYIQVRAQEFTFPIMKVTTVWT